jgi:hypothetical protein
MTIKHTILTIAAAGIIAASASTFASAADGARELGDAPLQNGFVNSDGSSVANHPAGFGYSMNKAPVSKLSGADYTYQPTTSAGR